jgi:hypothetical protein
MSTFFISPDHELAPVVAEKLQHLPHDAWVSPRGKEWDCEEVVHAIISYHGSDPVQGLPYAFTRVCDWLADYSLLAPRPTQAAA